MFVIVSSMGPSDRQPYMASESGNLRELPMSCGRTLPDVPKADSKRESGTRPQSNGDTKATPMVRGSRDNNSLSHFKRNTPEFLRQLKKTGQPVVLTINGKAGWSSRTPAPIKSSWRLPSASRSWRHSVRRLR